MNYKEIQEVLYKIEKQIREGDENGLRLINSDKVINHVIEISKSEVSEETKTKKINNICEFYDFKDLNEVYEIRSRWKLTSR